MVDETWLAVGVALAVGAVLALWILTRQRNLASHSARNACEPLAPTPPAPSGKAQLLQKRTLPVAVSKRAREAPTSPSRLLASVLKGHTDHVVQVVFCPDGQHLATLSADHSLRLWKVSELEQRAHSLPGRINIEQNEGMEMHFSRDSKHVVVGLVTGTLRVFRFSKGHGSHVMDFPQQPLSPFPFVGVGLAGKARAEPGEHVVAPYMVSAQSSPTALHFWSLSNQGPQLLQTVDVNMVVPPDCFPPRSNRDRDLPQQTEG